ncbi:MAG: seg [Parcubacteria group bacterium]|nr:seg [Parcubacteria group bacterium]
MRIALQHLALLGLGILFLFAPAPAVHAQTTAPPASGGFPAQFTDSSGIIHKLVAGSQYTQTPGTPRQCAKYTGFANDYGCINPDGTLDQCFVGPNAIPSCTTPKTADGGSTTSSQVANTSLTTNTDASGKTTADAQPVDKSCSINTLDICLANAGTWIIKQIALLFLFIASFFAGLSGFLFNWIVYITVFQFGNLIGNNPGMLAAWGVLRDIGNILLLFGFIFMGISTILNLPGNEFTAKRALPALIIFAILMNFSLFAAEAVIDTSNAIGTTLYKQASQGLCTSGESQIDCATNKGIAGSIFKVSGISAIFNKDAAAQIPGNDFGAVIEILGLAIFAAVTAFVFFAALFLFITRAVVLAFLMAVSPIGFAGMAVPPLHEYASMWWQQLLKQSFFAPIYILLILISIKFMEGITTALNTASGGGATLHNLADAFSVTGASNVSMVVDFMLITGFMLGSLIIAKQMGAAGADRATKFAGAATFGTTAFIGRRTVGRAMYSGASALRGTKFGQTNTVGKFLVNSFDKGSKSNFDAGRAILGGIAKSQHLDIGTAQKGGYAGIVHAEEEKRKEFAKKLTATKEDKKVKEGLQTTKNLLQGELQDAEAELAAQVAVNEAALKPTRTALAQKYTQLQQARASGNAALAATLEKEFENDTKAYELEKEVADKKLDPAKARMAEAKKYMSQTDGQLKQNGQEPQRRYAESLDNNIRNPLDWWSYAGGVGNDADHHAATEILKNLDKSENERVVDAISALGGKLGGGGGGAPPAGGGDAAAH